VGPLTLLRRQIVEVSPDVKDGALALILLVLFLLPPLTTLGECWEYPCEDFGLLGWFLAVLSVAPLALTRRFPLSVLATLTLVQLAWGLLGYATHAVQSLPILVGIYAVATSSHRLPVRFLALTPPSLFVAIAANHQAEAALAQLDLVTFANPKMSGPVPRALAHAELDQIDEALELLASTSRDARESDPAAIPPAGSTSPTDSAADPRSGRSTINPYPKPNSTNSSKQNSQNGARY